VVYFVNLKLSSQTYVVRAVPFTLKLIGAFEVAQQPQASGRYDGSAVHICHHGSTNGTGWISAQRKFSPGSKVVTIEGHPGRSWDTALNS
jgi:hypothetical protein